MIGSLHTRVSRLSWASIAALGAAIGLVMAAATVADAVLWRPFASHAGGAIVAVFARHTAAGRERELTSFAVFKDWQSRSTVFERLSGYQLATVNVLGDPAPMTLRAAAVADGFFEALQTSLARGRTFRTEEHEAERAGVCVISDALWRTHFGGAASVVGTTVRVEQVSGSVRSGVFTIVGIAPPTFRYPERVEVWVPFVAAEPFAANRSGQWFGVVGRLRSGVALTEATAEMGAVMSGVQSADPMTQPPHGPNLVPLREVLTAHYETLVIGLALAAGVLLLVVIASTGGVLVARALREQRNDAIRLSLGAGPGRLLFRAAGEGFWLGVIAFGVAVPMAMGCLVSVDAFARQLFDLPLDARLTWSSALAGLSLAVAVALALTLFVKRHAVGYTLRAGLHPHQPGIGGTRATAMLRSALIVGEIALSVVLLAAAGDLLRRVAEVRAVDLGMSTERLLTVRVALPPTRYSGTQAAQFYTSLMERVRGIPSVRATALSSDDLLFGASANPEFTLQVEGRAPSSVPRTPIVLNGVTEGYLDLVGIRLIDGEMPRVNGGGEEGQAVVVNQAFVRALFPDENPLGRRFRYGGRNPPWWTIAGIAADVRNDGPLAPSRPTAYLPYPAFGKADMTVLVKTTGEPDLVVPQIRTIVKDLDHDLPIGRLASAVDLVESRFASLRIGALVVALLAAAALMLSGLGLYGVLAAAFGQIRPEIGLRMALGAGPRDMVCMVLGRAARLVLAGVVLGTAITAVIGLAARSRVSLGVPSAVQVAALIASVAAVSLAAAIVPAWQAARVRPVDALRAE